MNKEQEKTAKPEFVPKTELGRRLWEIQKRIVESGEGLLSTVELRKEIDATEL